MTNFFSGLSSKAAAARGSPAKLAPQTSSFSEVVEEQDEGRKSPDPPQTSFFSSLEKEEQDEAASPDPALEEQDEAAALSPGALSKTSGGGSGASGVSAVSSGTRSEDNTVSPKGSQHSTEGAGAETEAKLAQLYLREEGPVPRPPKRGIKPRAMSLQQSNASDFEPIRLLGKGAFGVVVEVKKTTGHTAGKLYAMKVMSKVDLVDRGVAETARVEREILRSIRHPFLVWLCYAFQTRTKLYLVTELFHGGSLHRVLRKKLLKPDNYTAARKIGAQCALAMSYLHSRGVIHRDIKSANVLIDMRGDSHLADYGLAAYCDMESMEAPRRSFCGTIEYMAPELLLNTERYTAAVDFWALGCLLYEMIDGHTPFHCKASRELFTNILHGEPTIDDAVFDAASQKCILPLLRKQPRERAGLAQLREDGFLEIAREEARLRDLYEKPSLVEGLSDTELRPEIIATAPSEEDRPPPDETQRERNSSLGSSKKDAFDFLRSVDNNSQTAAFRQDAFAGFGYRFNSGCERPLEWDQTELDDVTRKLGVGFARPVTAPSRRQSFMSHFTKRFARPVSSTNLNQLANSPEKKTKGHRRNNSSPSKLFASKGSTPPPGNTPPES